MHLKLFGNRRKCSKKKNLQLAGLLIGFGPSPVILVASTFVYFISDNYLPKNHEVAKGKCGINEASWVRNEDLSLAYRLEAVEALTKVKTNPPSNNHKSI